MRFLGVDVGQARTGLALSDPVGITCRPLDIVHERDPEAVITAILVVAEREGVGTIVVGLPRPLSGGSNEQLKTVEDFVERLAARSPRPVNTWDERFTSKLARVGKAKGQAVDSVAACHMLQGYLDRRSNAVREEE
ncbi:MAG: Holliday junction resolvase RuvX [Thermoleophilia bacterium]